MAARRNARPTRSTRAPRKTSAPSILFLFGDAAKLRADGLRLELPSFVALGATLLAKARADIIEATALTDLEASVQTRARHRKHFDVVVVVGHGNDVGVRLAHDSFHDWHALTDLLRPLQPKRLVLVTCDGGRWPAAQVLFAGLPKLRRIFASATKASRNLGGLLVMLAPYLLANKAPKSDEVLVAQVGGFLLGGGQIRQWTRTKDAGNAAAALHDLGATVVDEILRRASGRG